MCKNDLLCTVFRTAHLHRFDHNFSQDISPRAHPTSSVSYVIDCSREGDVAMNRVWSADSRTRSPRCHTQEYAPASRIVIMAADRQGSYSKREDPAGVCFRDPASHWPPWKRLCIDKVSPGKHTAPRIPIGIGKASTRNKARL